MQVRKQNLQRGKPPPPWCFLVHLGSRRPESNRRGAPVNAFFGAPGQNSAAAIPRASDAIDQREELTFPRDRRYDYQSLVLWLRQKSCLMCRFHAFSVCPVV